MTFLRRDGKGVASGGWEGGEELRVFGGGETVISIFCMKITIFTTRRNRGKKIVANNPSGVLPSVQLANFA